MVVVNRPIESLKDLQSKSYNNWKVLYSIKIPNSKHQNPNKFQHAAQAPALRVTQIQNPKPMLSRHMCQATSLPSGRDLGSSTLQML